MNGKIKKVGNNLLHNDSIVYTFLRSIVSSQAASWIDLLSGFLLFAFLHIGSFYATAIGAIAGGIVNCVINYHFTFHASSCSWRAVVVKYALVWVGSLLLNSYGTEALYALLSSWDWLEDLGFRPNGYYAAARLTVSLLVSWFWNFLLQRYFVYRVTRFDPYAISLVKSITPHNKREDKSEVL